MYGLNLDNDGRVLSAAPIEYAPINAVIVENIPEGNINDYLCVNGVYTYDPIPEPEPEVPDEPAGELSVWDELDGAYQKGVDSV